MAIQINTVYHPDYSAGIVEWQKWRLAYNGDRQFVQTYLKQLSARETVTDYAARKEIAYVPRFAAAALDEVKNSIYQRMSDVTRAGGPQTYQRACLGELGGVDLTGSMMNTFMGTDVLREMLVMKRVGVLIDAPRYEGRTLLDKGDKHPYLSLFCSERIQSWNWIYENNMRKLGSVLLNEEYNDINEYDLPSVAKNRYRLLQLIPGGGGVKVTFFDPVYDSRSSTTTYPPAETVILDIKDIPFVCFEIPCSLMQTAADYQIALMNIESSDVSFVMKANYPFFYEFYDEKAEPTDFKPPGVSGSTGTAPQNNSSVREVKVGGSQGRRYPKTVTEPGFVNPNPETLKISMEKGENLKDDIFRLVNLNLHNAARSAESKQESERTLESQLSFLGLILQKGEIQIGEIWAQFEGSTDIPKVTYPENYSLKTEEERQLEADNLSKARNDTPSSTYKKAIAKKIARLRVGPDVSNQDWKKIVSEIDSAACLLTDPTDLVNMHKEGILDTETCVVAVGVDKSVAQKAKDDRVEMAKLIMEAQGGPTPGGGGGRGAAAGVPELGGKTGTAEKANLPQRGAAQS